MIDQKGSRMRKRGFTLIELLVVVGLIGLLMGMAIPAVRMLIENSRRARAQSMVAALHAALRTYQQEDPQRRFPPAEADLLMRATGVVTAPAVIDLLVPAYLNAGMDGLAIDPADSSRHVLLDPWKRGYRYQVDRLVDGTAQRPDPAFTDWNGRDLEPYAYVWSLGRPNRGSAGMAPTDDPDGHSGAGAPWLYVATRGSGAAMKRNAFTLIELLVVVSIIAVLAGMAMPLLAIARDNARASSTRSVMARVDGALRQFKTDYRVYPYQLSYADVDGGEQPSNRLAYHLGSELSDAQRSLVIQDMDAAAAQCSFVFSGQWSSSAGSVAFISADVGDLSGGPGALVMLNRMNAERMRLSVLAGCTTVTGPRITQFSGAVRDLSAVRAVPTPLSKSIVDLDNHIPGPGWAVDYLAGELEPRFIRDQAILDAWHRPLAYVCQALPTCRPTMAMAFYVPSLLSDVTPFGLNTPGRTVLAKSLPADGGALPDPEHPLHSDRRRYAAPGLENEFELWSCGKDGQLGWMRDDARNRDNVPLLSYDSGLR